MATPRFAVNIETPPGILGIDFGYGYDSAQRRCIHVAGVDSRSPLRYELVVGDIVVSVNGVPVAGQEIAFVHGILVGSQASSRFFSILRAHPPSTTGRPAMALSGSNAASAVRPAEGWLQTQKPGQKLTRPSSAAAQASQSNNAINTVRNAAIPMPQQTLSTTSQAGGSTKARSTAIIPGGSLLGRKQKNSSATKPSSEVILPDKATSATTTSSLPQQWVTTNEATAGVSTSEATAGISTNSAASASLNKENSTPEGAKKSQEVSKSPITRRAIRIPIPTTEDALGIGIKPTKSQKYIRVFDVEEDSILRGKILKGDLITHIGGSSVKGKTIDEAKALLKTTRTTSFLIVLRDPTKMSLLKPKQVVNNPSALKRKEAPTVEGMTSTSATQVVARVLAASSNPIVAAGKKKEAPAVIDLTSQSQTSNVGAASKRKMARKELANKQKRLKKNHDGTIEFPETYPEQGCICENAIFYCTKNNETVAVVAEKLGCEYKDLAENKSNVAWYGKLSGASTFKANTLLVIPEKRSKWKIKQLSTVEFPDEAPEECLDCGSTSNRAEILLCDGCDGTHHTHCVGLDKIPDGDWFCSGCLEILKARKEHGDFLENKVFKLPQVPSLGTSMSPIQTDLVQSLRVRLNDYLQGRRQNDLQVVRDQSAASKLTLQQLITMLEAEIDRLRSSMPLVGHNQNSHTNWARIWARREALSKELSSTRENLNSTKAELKNADKSKNDQEKIVRLKYAALLGEPKLHDETMTEFKNRPPFPPRYMGQITAQNDEDVFSLYLLREPDELILLVPMDDSKTEFEPEVGQTYGVFGCPLLFDRARDDEMPMEANGVRDAQRQLFRMLLDSRENKHFVVSLPSTPPSVDPRSDRPDNSFTRCFDLSELVRDCNLSLDLPREPTPKIMEENGLHLRHYQQQSLRFLLDKESPDSSGLGLAGEFWHRLRFLENEMDDFFFCELTGSFSLDIFDYKDEVNQRDASRNRFNMPTGCILGDEMGLGKTVVAIALIVANPVPINRRVLKREHLWSLERKAVEHEAYVPLPRWGVTENLAKSNLMSNGTLVIVPASLLSQWQTEIERYAPHLSVMVIHSAENPSLQAIASADIVIASEFIFQRRVNRHNGAALLLGRIKRIHWHRIIVDEAHTNAEDHALTNFLGVLSASHRLSITGTPLGSKISDITGQLRMLRLAPFHRTAFWRNNLQNPYGEHNMESLRVLRTLLSHIVCRHSKEQTHADGKALLELPPRNVETTLLKFGSEQEQKFYDILETNNRTLLRKLAQESKATVQHSFFELQALLLASRQCCAHSSMVDLDKLDRNTKSAEGRKHTAMGGDFFGRAQPRACGQENETRASLLKLAAARARPTAKSRMIDVVSQFQTSGVLVECPVCLSCVDERGAALPPCSHPLCSECIMGLLSASTASREPSGSCPTCRNTFRRSEITFLGNAQDAGTYAKKPALSEESSKTKDVFEETVLPSFHLNSAVVHAASTGASTFRVNGKELLEAEVSRTVQEAKAEFSSLTEDFLSSYVLTESRVGSKIAKLLQEINAMMAKDSSSKAVVFSQWQAVLDITAQELTARNIGLVRIDRTQQVHQRADALLEFASNPSKKVFLLSLGTGATGLTLTAADHCFIMDVAQNSAVEEQAIDRIHRIGQTRPVTVKRFVMEGTVEERILSVRRKLLVDRPTVSTGICGTNDLGNDERASAAAKKSDSEETKSKRVELLEKLIGKIDVQLA